MNPLFELIPAIWRKWLYAIVSAGAFVLSVHQAASGDWAAFAAAIIPALTGALAASNTAVKVDDVDGYDGHGTYADEVSPEIVEHESVAERVQRMLKS